MDILRRIFLVLAALVLPILLWVFAIDTGLVRTISNPTNIKKIVADSGLYSSAVDSAFEQVKQTATSSGELSLVDPAVKSAAAAVFTPQMIQTNVESVIDSIYAWLNGQGVKPDFKVDLASAKADFAVQIAKNVQQRLASLPACSASVSAKNFDAYKATCLPKGVSVATVAEQVRSDIATSQNFLGNPIITADTVKSSDSSQSIFDQNSQEFRDSYRWLKQSPIMLGILAALAALSFVLLNKDRRKGLKKLAIMLLVIGGLLLLFAWAVNNGVQKQATIKVDNKVLQDKLHTLLVDATKQLNETYWLIGGAYAGLGALMLIGAMAMKRGSKADDGAEKDEPKTETKPTLPAETVTTDEGPKFEATPPPKITIQKAPPKPKPKSVPKKIKVS